MTSRRGHAPWVDGHARGHVVSALRARYDRAMPNAPVPRFMTIGYAVAFVAVTAAGVLQSADAPSVSRAALAVLTAVAVIYAGLGTLGLGAIERRGSRAGLWGVFAALLVLGV